MPDPFSRGNVPARFRGLQVSLWAAHGTWWYEVVPAPTTAEERLRRPWRAVYRVAQLDLPSPITWSSILFRMGCMATDLSLGESENLIPIR